MSLVPSGYERTVVVTTTDRFVNVSQLKMETPGEDLKASSARDAAAAAAAVAADSDPHSR